jgi:CheY-like chemotaxis protein
MLNLAAGEDPLGVIDAAKSRAAGTPIAGCFFPPQSKRALAAGARGHLIKPVSLAELETAIRSVGKPVQRVLVVDDDAEALELFARMLAVCDGAMDVETARSGREALERLRGTAFDLVLLDIVMPGMDGWQVLERLRIDGESPGAPVFFLSAQDVSEQPLSSNCLIASIDRGLSIESILRCSLEVSALLLSPEGGLDPVPRRVA